MRYVSKTFTVELMCENWDAGQPLQSSEDVFHFVQPIYKSLDADKEYFLLIVLTQKNRVQGHKVISTGSLVSTLVHPREVFTAVLNPEWRAGAIVFVHNHPSGDPAPSPEDIEITRRLKEIADLFGIRMTDHVILGHEQYFSFRDRGML